MTSVHAPAAARVALATLLAAASVACAGPRAEAPAGALATPAAVKVDGPTAVALVRGGARLVDVRSPQEFAGGHLPGAVNVPYDEVGLRLGEVGPAATEVVLYCRTGRRSALAAEALRRHGYGKLYDLGPMSGWPEADAAPSPATQGRPP
jgi:phage shock protein E